MKYILIALVLSMLPLYNFAQTSLLSNMHLNGYIKYMNSNAFNQIDSTWIVSNLFHNRLNFSWDINKKMVFHLESRNRFFYGDMVTQTPNYGDLIASDNGFLNFLTNNIVDEKSVLLTSTFDRAFVEYNTDKVSVSIGRQRINWGQALVWNPNDLFNSYSFYDFDYEERPGSDAIRLQYYPNFTSAIEIAAKIDRNNQVTAAGLYRFNKWQYDIQLLAGIIDSSDIVLGGGWSGHIKDYGFYGEATYFHPQTNFADSSGVFIASVGLNYAFNGNVNLNIEGLYNGYFKHTDFNNVSDIYSIPLSVKSISYSEFSWFGQVNYLLNPLLNGGLAVMYYPSLGNGYFIMPSLAYSLKDNVELSFYAQRLGLHLNNSFQQSTSLYFRLRWSF